MGLPELGIDRIKAKIDTGARSSSIHASDLEQRRRRGETWVRFVIHPRQRSVEEEVEVHAKVLEFRSIRSSNGTSSMRPVIVTPVTVLGVTWPIELTLASRDEMGFRMLLGRQAVRHRFLVDPGRSYFGGGEPPRSRRPSTKKSPPQTK